MLVLGKDGRARTRNDPFVTGRALTPAAAGGGVPGRGSPRTPGAEPRPGFTPELRRATGPSGGTGVKKGSTQGSIPNRKRTKRRRKPAITIASVLSKLRATNAINQTAYARYSGSLNAALAAEKHLSGTRRNELTAVTQTLHQIAASKQMTPSRLPAMFATLDANRQWWTTGPLLSSGQRVEFTGSQLVWEYYPGQGIQLQVLGSFGKADGLYTAGAADYPAMVQLLSEIIPLASQRAGGLAWEYYFNFDGGAPPWTSAMSQATGLEALTRAYQATGNQYYLQIAAQAMPLFTRPPPAGVAVATPVGTRFLQYTFAPTTAIINAFLQTLIGLYDYSRVSGNPQAAQLFAAGNAEALAELPSYDTGAWSLYQPGVEDTLSYHQLVTGFLAQLCTITADPLYCSTAVHFQTYEITPPGLTQLTFRARARKSRQVRFQLSKYSHVGITVSQGTQTKFATSASFPYGVDYFTIPPLKNAGVYTVTLTATDLAGNFARITGTLGVSS